MTNARITRRTAIKAAAAGLAAPMVLRHHATAAPSETLYHASFGGNGMALSDIRSLAASKHLKLVAVAEVDLRRIADVKKQFPDVRIYQDWRELLDKEKTLNSANISTPDHMHAPITMRAMQQGLHVYTQKPLTRTLHEARQLTLMAEKKPDLVTQMGIQIHSHGVHRTVVAMVRSGVIGKVKEVHSWSGKQWGDRNPRPDRSDAVPEGLNWDLWLGVAGERPYLNGYYHPGNWRKRLDFGTGTFGDMGCHILDPVFAALALTHPKSLKSVGEAPNADSWGLASEVRYVYPGTKYTTEEVVLTWYDGDRRPPEPVARLVGGKLNDQGSIYLGTEGVLYSPYIAAPRLFPIEKFENAKLPSLPSEDHYQQFVEACRGNAKASAPFAFAGPLTEMVLIGCLATRFPNLSLEWDTTTMTFTNSKEATALVRTPYRKGWEIEGL